MLLQINPRRKRVGSRNESAMQSQEKEEGSEKKDYPDLSVVCCHYVCRRMKAKEEEGLAAH